MTKQELKLILKLIDLHTNEYQTHPCYPTTKSIDNIDALKRDIKDLLDDKGVNEYVE